MQAQSIEICYQKNIGGSQRVQIAYRENLSIPLRSSYQATDFTFLYAPLFALDLPAKAHNIDYSLSLNSQQIKVVIDTPTSIHNWESWFRNQLANRVVSLSITNPDGYKEVIHNLQVLDFSQLQTNNRGTAKVIELSFLPAKIREATVDVWKKIIESVVAQTSQFNPFNQTFTDVIINLFAFCDVSIFQFGYATTNDVTEVIYQGTRTQRLSGLPNGVYYFFAVHRTLNKYYDSIKGTILNGNISFDTDIQTQNTNTFSVDGDQSNNDFDGSIDGDITTN